MEIIRATVEQAEVVAPLFDLYRQFYKAASDLEGSARFLRERLERNESVIFLAMDAESAVGFVQMYPVFASVQLKRLWILNDLYVLGSERKRGIGEGLMKRAEEYARETGTRGLFLRTATDNLAAQRLYEACGWVRDTKFYRYDLIVE